VWGCTAERWRVRMRMARPRRRTEAAAHGKAAQGTNDRNRATTRAQWGRQRHLQEDSQHGSKVGLTQRRRGGGRYDSPPRREGRASTDEWGSGSSPRWPRAEVQVLVEKGEAGGRRGRSRRRGGQRKQRRRLHRGTWLHGVQELHGRPPVLAAAPASLPRTAPPSPPLPPVLLLLRRAVVWTGDETSRRLGLGARGGAVAAYLQRRSAMDVWTARMRRRARGRIATTLQLGAAAPRSTGVTKEKGRRVTTATSS
jgi:hypothetical protein